MRGLRRRCQFCRGFRRGHLLLVGTLLIRALLIRARRILARLIRRTFTFRAALGVAHDVAITGTIPVAILVARRGLGIRAARCRTRSLTCGRVCLRRRVMAAVLVRCLRRGCSLCRLAFLTGGAFAFAVAVTVLVAVLFALAVAFHLAVAFDLPFAVHAFLFIADAVQLALRLAQQTQVMFGVLLKVFGRHPVIGQGSVARQLVVFINDLLRRAAYLALGPELSKTRFGILLRLRP